MVPYPGPTLYGILLQFTPTEEDAVVQAHCSITKQMHFKGQDWCDSIFFLSKKSQERTKGPNQQCVNQSLKDFLTLSAAKATDSYGDMYFLKFPTTA